MHRRYNRNVGLLRRRRRWWLCNVSFLL